MEAPGHDLLVVDDVEIDAPQAGEVVVAISNCGVCHSDLHMLDGSLPFPVPGTMQPLGIFLVRAISLIHAVVQFRRSAR